MGVTLTVDTLMANLAIDDVDDNRELVTARLAYVTEAVEHYAPSAPDVVHDEAAIRLAGYIYDSPRAPSGTRYANALRNSGAGSMLFRYRVHSAGVANAVADANAVGLGTPGNPVVGVAIIAGELVVTFSDGTSETYDLPAGGGGGGVLSVSDGRLPADPVQMRMAWSLPNAAITANTFASWGTVGTTDETLSPEYPQSFRDAGVDSAILVFWAATDLEPSALPLDTGDVGEQSTPLQIVGVDGFYWTTVDPVSRFFAGIPFSMLFPGLLIATQDWVTARIAQIMLSGGGITTAQAQALIDTAVADFQTATEIEAIVTAAIDALPNYQTLAEITTLISTAVSALLLGQTAAEVQALIDAHAALPNIHHTPGRPQQIMGPWRWTYLTPMQSGLVYYAAEELAGVLDTWIFTAGSNAVALAQLTDLELAT